MFTHHVHQDCLPAVVAPTRAVAGAVLKKALKVRVTGSGPAKGASVCVMLQLWTVQWVRLKRVQAGITTAGKKHSKG
eukprot:364269-Chlamydomonas_euryale.AAC.3